MSMIVETLVVELKETGGKKAASGLKKVAVASAGVYAAYKLISKGLKVVNDAWKVQDLSDRPELKGLYMELIIEYGKHSVLDEESGKL